MSHAATDVDDDTEQDTLDRLSDIAIKDDPNEFSKFQLDALKTHNSYRRKHKVQTLKLDADLCKRNLVILDGIYAENFYYEF